MNDDNDDVDDDDDNQCEIKFCVCVYGCVGMFTVIYYLLFFFLVLFCFQ